ncbi:MAG: hypothetical protein RLZZ200_1986 [Pseudomonadota bacterium]|jgi:hypothetical protein
MDRPTRHRHRAGRFLRSLAACLALAAAGPATAAVAILSSEGAPALVLVDADKLDPALLKKLAAAGFGAADRYESGCEITDAALLADRLGRAERVIALLAAADADLVQTLLQQHGRSMRSQAAVLLGQDAPPDLRALRDAFGERALSLRAIETVVTR